MAAEDDGPQDGGEATASHASRRSDAPLTIDLEAAPAEAKPANHATGGRFGWPSLIAAAVLGGVVAAVLGALVYAMLPSAAEKAAEVATAKAAETAVAVAALDRRVATLEARPEPGPDPAIAGLADRLTALETSTAEAKRRLEEISKQPLAAAGTSDPAIADLNATVGSIAQRTTALEAALATSAGAPGPGVDPALVAALDNRLSSLEASLDAVSKRVTAVAARPVSAAESERAVRAVAVGVVRAASAAGKPFAGDLAMLGTLGFDDDTLAKLRPLAARGAPSTDTLQAEFPAVADAIIDAASAPGPDAGFLDRLSAFGASLVSVRPTSPVPGATPEAIVSRMQGAVDKGDLADALAERESLPEPAKVASAAWAVAAADRITIDQLVDGLVASANAPANGP